jgi:hypothetical protein
VRTVMSTTSDATSKSQDPARIHDRANELALSGVVN